MKPQSPEKLPRIVGSTDQLRQIATRFGVTVAILAITSNRSNRLIRDVLDARMSGLSIREMAEVYEQLTGRIPVGSIYDGWLLFADGFHLLSKGYTKRAKRLFDLLLSGLLLILSAPLWAVIAAAIRMDSPGPILFHQRRVGKGGRTFTMHKFRTMRSDAEDGGARWAAEKDPRVTGAGRWLRLTRLDEIPQLINLLKGDMSLVGPRPERPEFVGLLEKEIPYYSVRHGVAPGITGWAQVHYRYGASLEDARNKLEYDLYYVKNMSILLDLRILLKTIGVVLLMEGSR